MEQAVMIGLYAYAYLQVSAILPEAVFNRLKRL